MHIESAWIQKRDGRHMPFAPGKIAAAINKAFRAVGRCNDEQVRELTDQVCAALQGRYFSMGVMPHVEEIQDLVEKALIAANEAAAAKAYILYRERRAEMRDTRRNLLDSDAVIMEYLSGDGWRVRENSNMSYSLQGLNLHIAGTIVAKYWLRRLYPLEVRMAHEEGDLHIHDLSVLGPYCVGWDLEDLLREGFHGVPGKIESNPAKHFRSALGQIVNFFYTLQGEAAGAQAFSNVDTLLAPFIRCDRLSYEEVRQAVQEFVFNLNVPTRVGFQTPFTNITLDLTPPSTLRDKPAVVGGRELDETYGAFQHEMNLFNRALAEVLHAGDARGRIFTFPIPTYNIGRDFPWDDDELEPLWRMTARYGIPYFANFVNSDMSPEDARSMCCRLRLDNRELWKRGGGLFGSSPLTGSIGVVTLNLPRIGRLAGDEQSFFALLDRRLELAVEALEIKRKAVEHHTDNGLYPYSRFYLRSLKASWGKYWDFHFATVGIVGMHEALLNFMDRPITSPEGKEFARRVLDHLRRRLQEVQERTGHMYNLEATPAESAASRLARLDRQRHPDIVTSGRDVPYYTNSVHPPVENHFDMFELLEHQDDLQTLFTGGTVVHLFLGRPLEDWRVLRNLARRITDRFHLPYFSFTPTFSISPSNGYLPGLHRFDPRPQSDDDIDRFGVEMEVSREELSRLDPRCYRTAEPADTH